MTSVELIVLGAAGTVAVGGLAIANLRLAIVVLMSAAAFTMTWNDVRLGSLTLSDLLLIATIGLVAISPIQVRPLRKLISRAQKSLLLYAMLLLVGGLVGGIIRQQPDVGWDVALRFAISVVTIAFLVSVLVKRRDDFELYAMWYVLGAAVNAIVAITGGELVVGRSIGFTNHPNHLGLAMLLALFLAIATLGSPNKFVSRVTAVSILPIIAAIILSGSRGALLASSVGLLALILMKRGRATPWLSVVALAVVLLAFTLPQTLRSGTSGFGRLFSPTDSEAASGSERLLFYREATELIRDSPVFGEGFSQALVFHSVPLQVLVVGGVFGLAGFFFLVRGALRAVRYAVVPGRPILEQACGAGLIATAVFLLVANALFDRYYLFFVSMAFLACSPQLLSPVHAAQPTENAVVGSKGRNQRR